jgi:excisionase family DNA binding protein
MTEPSKRLGIGEAAMRLGVSVSALREWADAGRVKHVRTLGGRRQFEVDEIDRVARAMGLEHSIADTRDGEAE